MIEELALLDDPQERLGLVVDRARQRPQLPAAERTEANRVRGCISQAWVVASADQGRLTFRSDADSPLVRGLVALLCDLYSDATPADILATDPEILDRTGLARNLSPTRLNGLRSVRARIRELAATAAPA